MSEPKLVSLSFRAEHNGKTYHFGPVHSIGVIQRLEEMADALDIKSEVTDHVAEALAAARAEGRREAAKAAKPAPKAEPAAPAA